MPFPLILITNSKFRHQNTLMWLQIPTQFIMPFLMGAPPLATWNPESHGSHSISSGTKVISAANFCGSRQELHAHYQPRVTELGSHCSPISMDVNTAQHS